MKLNLQIAEYYSKASRTLNLPYSQLTQLSLDMGFRSEIRDGKDFHQILREVVISVNKFSNNSLSNLIFSQNQQYRIEYQDSDIVNYYNDYIELRYIFTGHQDIEIEGTIVTFHENEICFIDSMAYHREIISSSNCIAININIEKNAFNEAFFSQIGLNPLQKFIRSNIMKKGERNHYIRFSPSSASSVEVIQNLISKIFQEMKSCQAGYLYVSKGYIVRLMEFLSHEYELDIEHSFSEIWNDKLFESVSEYISNHLSDIKIEDLINEFHFNENFFNQLIKKHLGVTYSEYVIHLRMERTKELLVGTRLSIEDIMNFVGYNNKGFFYKKFKKETGMSPAEFRKKA